MEEDNTPIEDGIKKSLSKRKSHTEKIRENPWILSTVVLGILTLVLILPSLGITGGAISEDDAGRAVINFANAQGVDAELVKVEKDGLFYQVTLLIQGREVPIYVTQDGKNLVQGLTPLEFEEETPTNSQQTEVPKSDKPEVELFIWAYCPYGVQAQGPFTEVASLLKDSADMKVVLYYDGHGAYETQQNKIQECIQKLYPDKYWDYASGFVEDIYPNCGSSRDIECNEQESIDLMKSLGISSTKVMSCVEQDGDDLFSEASQRAKAVGVTGSPSLVINGVKVNAARTAEAFKTAVCEAFNDAPEECSTVLSSDAGTASGNC